MKAIQAFESQGKQIIYVSFGTVVGNLLWNFPGADEGLKGKTLQARSSGRVFCTALWKLILDSLGGRSASNCASSSSSLPPLSLTFPADFTLPLPLFSSSDMYGVVLSSGPHFKDLNLPVPDNVIVREFVPQVEVLSRSDIFIT